MSDLLKVENLKMYYHTSSGEVKAINDISFNIKTSETLGIVGESGCGKTSLGTSLLGMPSIPGKYESGKIIIDGENIIDLKEEYIRKNIRWVKISMVFQGAMNSLTPVYTIGKQMLETLNRHIEMDKTEALKLIEEYLGYVGLHSNIANRYPHELSGGMKQRSVIAAALFLKPKLVILDEPTTALDVIVQAQIINLLKNSLESIEDKGRIELSSNIYKKHLDIIVEDNGIGMTKEELEKVTEMFYTTKPTGSGLGVALSNEIIKAHNGELIYTSEKNKGTKVTIRLPYNG